jgi:2-(1,2-epoxy-1,2-dihydrophenyl)acetyl-CoA isomerase
VHHQVNKGVLKEREDNMEDAIKKESREKVTLLTLNRPEAYNAFDLPMVRELAESLIHAATSPEVAGLVITGMGKAFCAGGSLKWVLDQGGDYGAAFHSLAAYYHQAIVEIKRMPKPVVAAINGLAAGGGFSMALACDFRIMERSAVLRQGYTSNGLSIDGGGTYTLPRLVGMARALEIAAFDRPIPAEKALEWGLVTEVVPDGGSVERAMALMAELKARSLSSFSASKSLITDSFETNLEAQLEKEREMLSWCGGHPNGREGIEAFNEKRKPVYNR